MCSVYISIKFIYHLNQCDGGCVCIEDEKLQHSAHQWIKAATTTTTSTVITVNATVVAAKKPKDIETHIETTVACAVARAYNTAAKIPNTHSHTSQPISRYIYGISYGNEREANVCASKVKRVVTTERLRATHMHTTSQILMLYVSDFSSLCLLSVTFRCIRVYVCALACMRKLV